MRVLGFTTSGCIPAPSVNLRTAPRLTASAISSHSCGEGRATPRALLLRVCAAFHAGRFPDKGLPVFFFSVVMSASSRVAPITGDNTCYREFSWASN